jgi:hypothetical protein
MAGCGASACATWLLFVGNVAYLLEVNTARTSEKADLRNSAYQASRKFACTVPYRHADHPLRGRGSKAGNLTGCLKWCCPCCNFTALENPVRASCRPRQPCFEGPQHRSGARDLLLR